jgi:hypothetical protein
MSAKQSKPPPLDKTLRAKVAEVIRQFPVRPELDSAEPIQRAARLITYIFVRSSNPRCMSRARRELAKSISLAQKLSAALKSMPPELQEVIILSLTRRGLVGANRLLDPVDPRLVLGREIQTLRNILCDAREHLAPRRGRPESQPAAAVSEVAAWVFTELTGNPATPGYNAYTEERSVFEQPWPKYLQCLALRQTQSAGQNRLGTKRRKNNRHSVPYTAGR